nr:alkaline phosphatase family protein [Dyadobacter chenwenxiniae]
MRKICLKALLILLSVSAFAQTSKKAVPKSSPLARPKLVVGIVVDQMRYDYLYRYYDQYQEGGFKRMMNEGFNCRNNHYNYALTVTAAGHASAYTGSVPAINGIVGNEWFDPITRQSIYCVEDSTVKTVGSTNTTVGKMSPKNLLTSTVSDQLRIATNFRNKTIAVAIKDRGSIFTGRAHGQWFLLVRFQNRELGDKHLLYG